MLPPDDFVHHSQPLLPWQAEFIAKAFGGDGKRGFLHTFNRSGRRFAQRVMVEDWLLFMAHAELRGDDLYVEFADGSNVCGLGLGRQLVEDVIAEAERATANLGQN